MNDRLFHPEHTWAKFEDGEAIIGITNYAQEQLGEVAYIDLPDVGDEIEVGVSFGDIESIKAVSDIISPISGTIIAVNSDLEDAPTLVNGEPYEKGWMLRVKVSDMSQKEALLSEEGYLNSVGVSQG
jgi:glycine cleavage system H protein